tara:strand:- start:185 stop:778 length:594 start_codon:yes stop_codon:yes gene_type:complete
MKTHHKDYLYSMATDSIDNKKLAKYCMEVEQMLHGDLPKLKEPHEYGAFTTSHHGMYNFLTLPNKEVNKLYYEILKQTFSLLEKKPYMIKSWLNVFYKGEHLKWHNHWAPEYKVWHGFYCVHVDKSHTDYKIPNVNNIIRIPSTNGLLVIGKSDGDKHCSSPWNETKRPRITIAFDIVPTESIDTKLKINHFIPFKI